MCSLCIMEFAVFGHIVYNRINIATVLCADLEKHYTPIFFFNLASEAVYEGTPALLEK